MNKIIPKFLYDKKIYGYISNLTCEGNYTYSSLDDFDKENITSLIIEVLGKESYEMFVDYLDFDVTSNLFKKFLSTSKTEHAYDLADFMRKQACNYYSSSLDELFKEISAQQKINNYEENGLIQIQDRQTGEPIWMRR